MLLVFHCFQVFIIGHLLINQTVRRDFNDTVCNCLNELMVMGCENHGTFKLISPLLTAVMDSKSKWLVGSSSKSTLEPLSIILESMQRTFSPPDRTEAFFITSSPEKSILPRKPRRKVSVSSCGENWRSHSTKC